MAHQHGPGVHRRSLLAVFALAGGTPFVGLAEASWPAVPVHMIVPFPAGSTPDLVARMLADQFRGLFGQPCVVDNRPGAGGTTGTHAIA